MKKVLPAALSVALAGASPTTGQEPSDAQAILAMGAYVTTEDMAASQRFYEVLFARAPVITLPDFIAFDIAGGWFAIASREKYAPASVSGSGAVPYLQSGELAAVQTRAAAAGAPATDIIEEPGIHLLKITDPNGQLVEFFFLAGR